MREIMITQDNENQRLDKFLLKYLNKSPKSFVYKMLRKKNIKLNDGKAFGGEMLAKGDCVKLYLSDETIAGFSAEKVVNEQAGGIDLVYEDGAVLVCNKPQGLLSHPENDRDRDTLIDRILLYLYRNNEYSLSENAVFTPGLCNRLDRNTSGVVVCGKTLAAAQWLSKAVRDQKTVKRYKAIVAGKITEPGTLTGFHVKDAGTNKAAISQRKDPQSHNAKAVVTHYKPIFHNHGFSYIDITLVTGKSHQIRAHLALIGHPVAGDIKYGDQQANDFFKRKAGADKQLLHGESIAFTEKEGPLGYLAGRTFRAEPPAVFQRALELIKQ